MKKFFAAILISAVACMPGTAIAQPSNYRCANEGVPIRQPNPFIFVCNIPLRSDQIGVISHHFSLDKFESDSSLKSIISLTIYSDGDRLITLGEIGSDKITQFWVRGRKFHRWAKSEFNDASMVNKHKVEIGILLNAFESSQAIFGTF